VRTRFRISSLSTDVMFVALLQLVDRGRLQLGDSLCKHIEPCPPRWRPITVRLLVDGRSGLSWIAALLPSHSHSGRAGDATAPRPDVAFSNMGGSRSWTSSAGSA
jgi:CubicO group peptidase (beta-lactamase class C family)